MEPLLVARRADVLLHRGTMRYQPELEETPPRRDPGRDDDRRSAVDARDRAKRDELRRLGLEEPAPPPPTAPDDRTSADRDHTYSRLVLSLGRLYAQPEQPGSESPHRCEAVPDEHPAGQSQDRPRTQHGGGKRPDARPVVDGPERHRHREGFGCCAGESARDRARTLAEPSLDAAPQLVSLGAILTRSEPAPRRRINVPEPFSPFRRARLRRSRGGDLQEMS